MHRSLYILEVLSTILSACSNGTLSALSRTCKLFEDPALDVLWHHQTSFLILLKTMPADLWEERQIVGDNNKYLHLRRPLVSTDLDVFNKYAKRMMVVSYPGGPESWVNVEVVSRDAVEVLCQFISPKPILPNLRKLFGWRPHRATYDPSYYTPVILLLGPKIEVLHIDLPTDPNLSTSFLRSIENLCPYLTSLHLSYPPDQELVLLAVSDLICHYNKLESLDVGCLTVRALSHIATLSRLRHLGLNSLPAERFNPPLGPGLAHLSTLVLTTREGVTAFTILISLIRPIYLRELELMMDYGSSRSMQWQQCFQELSCYSSSTLETLNIVQIDDGSADYVIGHATIEPLFRMRHLKIISMVVGAFDLGDDELEQMALAWPHLEELDLETCNQAAIGTTRITLMGLVPVLKHCPDLQKLNLPIDATSIDFHVLEQPGGVVSNHHITTMFVGDSLIEDPAAVAAFLSNILPNVQTIHSWEISEGPDGDHYRSLWNKVPYLIQRKSRHHRPPPRSG